MNTIINSLLTTCSTLAPMIQALATQGGTCYLVGGSVRDLILTLPIKDFDIEVHGITLETLIITLQAFGPVKYRGKAFGVIVLGGFDVDWSLPRVDSIGRKPDVAIDPFLGITKALQRRDVTMNAIALNITEVVQQLAAYTHRATANPSLQAQELFTLIDPYGGIADSATGTLRAVNPQRFSEDPLRFFRVMQFISRFAMTPDKELTTLCSTLSLRDAVSGQPLARERIIEELKKLVTLSKKPSLGLWWLVKINRLNELFPVTHTDFMLNNQATPAFESATAMLDTAAQRYYCAQQNNIPESSLHFTYLFAAFLAPQVASTQNLSKEALTTIIKQIITPLTDDHHLVRFIATLIYHQTTARSFFAHNEPAVVYKKLAWELEPLISLRQLAFFSYLIDTEKTSTHFLEAAKQAGVADMAEKALLTGNDLMPYIPAGPALGEVLQTTYVYQLENNVTDAELLKNYALQHATKLKK